MKKILLLASVLAFTSPVFAECQDGKEFVGYYDANQTFCVSTATMNWWSAFAWCQAHNMHLATFEEACPDAAELRVDVSWNSANCGNLHRGGSGSIGGAWIARAHDGDSTKALHLGETNPNNTPLKYTMNSALRTAKWKALCIQ